MVHSRHIAADLKNLSQVLRFIEETTLALGVEVDIIPKVQLAVDEAVTNIILHGYRGQEGMIEIKLNRRGDDLVVYLYDEARPFDPTLVPPPDLTLPLEKRVSGGLGIYLMRQVMDEIFHRITANGGNELILVKKDVGRNR